jgi:DNA (cytosine-5)-methyltransferase 1
MLDPVLLCGTMFKGLRVIRHRLFETNFWVRRLRCGYHPRAFDPHRDKAKWKDTDLYSATVTCAGKTSIGKNVAKDAMNMPWAKTLREVVEGIPPEYTRYIGRYMRDSIEGIKFRRTPLDFTVEAG